MKLIYSAVYFFHLLITSYAIENNVCPTIQDYYTIKTNSRCSYDVAADSKVPKIITTNGYILETHKVTTVDGYILTMFRIPSPYMETKLSTKGTVFLQHGWLCSSALFVGIGRNSLAFILADAGYDVWLGNFRGTEYSEEHVNLTVFDKEYWNYSCDEISLNDLPAQLDYVSEITGQRGNIVYIGYSLGTSAVIGLSATRPEYARQTMKLLILLAPAAKVPNIKAPFFRNFKSMFGPLLKTIDDNDLIRLVSQSSILRTLSRSMCLESPAAMERCLQMTNLLFAGPGSQLDAKTIPVLFNQFPSGVSFKVLVQIGDGVMNHFRKYDYGSKNMEIYGTEFPPDYNISKIEVPTFIMYAVGDWVATKKDALILYDSLPKAIKYGIHEISVPNFNHIDFLFGRDVKSLVYNHVLKLLDQFQ